jgi:four helix bundle protein
MRYEDWVGGVPENMKRERLWEFKAYPRALFLYDLMWQDSERLMKDVRGKAITKQLVDSAGSICANIEEGFGRGFGAEYAYFLRVALGSARETRGWYYRARKLLSAPVLDHRMVLLDDIIGALVKAAAHQKTHARKKR